MSYIVLTVFLLFGFGLLVGSDRLKAFILSKMKNENEEAAAKEETNFGVMGITLLTTIVTLAINFFLQTLSYILTESEQHQDKSSEKLSLIIKLVLTQFFNTAIMYYLLSILRQESTSQLLNT